MASPKVPGLRFNMSNPSAEKKIEKTAGRMITRMRKDTKDMAREHILEGFKAGKGPGDIALELAGRMNPRTGRREGGIIGVSGPQASAIRNFQSKLESGDLSALDYKLRDKRFDSTIKKAFENGEPLDADQIQKMMDRYHDNSLKLRGETIARTETGQAVSSSSLEAFEQVLEKTEYSQKAVKRIWRTSGNENVRDSHEAMEGQEVEGIDEPFITGNGAEMMAPFDSSLGAGAEEIINCACTVEIEIDFLEGLE